MLRIAETPPMKNLVLLFLLSLSIQASAQLLVPNGDFEIWDYYNTWTLDPEYWVTGNFQLSSNTYPDSSAYQGDLAMYVEPFHWVTAVPGLAMNTFDANYIPETFEFAVKCHIEGEDSVKVNVQFWNNNIKQYEEKWFSTSSIEEWEYVTLNLDNIEPVITHCIIEVWASYGSGLELEGSLLTTITVDAMNFDGLVGVSEIDSDTQWITYPIPVSGILHIDSQLGFNADRLVLRTIGGEGLIESAFSNRLDLTDIPPGIYILEAWNDEHLVGVRRVLVQ